MSRRLKEKIPIIDNICKLSCDQEKLYAQRFQGNPVRIKLLRKSKIDNSKLIKIIEIFLNQQSIQQELWVLKKIKIKIMESILN